MKIGVVGPFNPKSIEEYFDSSIVLPDINTMATSVNAYVKGLLMAGHKVNVFTMHYFDGHDYYIDGKNIRIFFVSTKFRIRGFGRLRASYRLKKLVKKQ